MRILFAASEIFPYAKTGGLADVAYSLPLALKKYVDIFRVMPLYGFMDTKTLQSFTKFTLKMDGVSYPVEVFQDEHKGIVTYFIQAQYLSDTEELYSYKSMDYDDNALRFGLFCQAIIVLALRLNIELIHLNDWHTALVPLYLQERKSKIKTLFTIHNLAYQGIYDASSLEVLGIDKKYFTMELLEFYGKVNFLKAGVALSSKVTTVSKNYAKEILSEKFSCGLQDFMNFYQHKIEGILNGIDYEVFPPLQERGEKKRTKVEFCKKFAFTHAKRPLFVMISRLVEQKGMDLLLASLDTMLQEKINFFILGEGEEQYVKPLQKFAKRYENFSFFQGYDEKLSHQTYLASDFLLMPSLFEPCGLNQFVAMNFASIPLVHEVGGLKESVHEVQQQCGRGITYQGQNIKEFLYALQRALKLFEKNAMMEEIISFNLSCDFSFNKSSQRYFELYRSIV